MTGSEQVVQWFLDHGADPNLRGKVDCSVLATAALKPSTSVLELLISHGTQLDPEALFKAMNPRGKGGVSAMKCLIDRGVDVNAVSSMAGSQGGTPLHYAVKLQNKEKVALLLEAGADKTMKNSSGSTPADLAKDKGCMEIFELLSR